MQKKLIVSITQQTITGLIADNIQFCFNVSTAKNGIGQLEGTGCTPLGTHVVADKFGENLPDNSVFVARQWTGEIYDAKLAEQFPDRDWILTRILWLQGCEHGFNLGMNDEGKVCDTKQRYIYIHGTPETEPMGMPLSHGCIRMHNDSLKAVFDFADMNTRVSIEL